jgi:hypothetical protein
MSLEPRNPRTRREWQAAADAAQWLLILDGCRQYGLITGGPEGKIERCIWILEEAKKRVITPREAEL